ncbi:GEVED domain-containing protein [Leucothrix arctica]|uniref:Uncharacterized protein n=1 Tax=Leucothrix arctica TaxID=1481894 RepID=A0A317CHV1_9GAMM|nr:GEVED domain-containing protein [Leucothrix arctica]PWQ97949.1 hypothetical protein DKT75_05650 [Leucothrix arctica]
MKGSFKRIWHVLISLLLCVVFSAQALADDFGDAPASYGDAPTVINANIYLGTTQPDSEAAGQPGNLATNDGVEEDARPSDFTGTNYFARFPLLVETASSYIVPVTVNNTSGSAATLEAWIDFDHSGTFDNDELTTVNVPNGTSGTVDVTWSSLPGIENGSTYIRLRLTDATGAGEVEDHVIGIAFPIPSESPSVTVIPDVSPLECQATVFEDDFNDIPEWTSIAPNRTGFQSIRNWTLTGGGEDTYAIVNNLSGYGSVIYLGNGMVRRIDTPSNLGSGFSFDANNRLTTTINAIELRSDPDDINLGTTEYEADWGPDPLVLSRSFPSEVGKTYRLYFTSIPEASSSQEYLEGIMRVDTPAGSAHFKIPAIPQNGNEADYAIDYAIEFKATSTLSTISFVNYGHFGQDVNNDCNPQTQRSWCTIGGYSSTSFTGSGEAKLDNVKLVESACETGTLTLLKDVTDGSAADTEWTLSAVDGPTTGISGAEGSTSVTNATVFTGTYNLVESNGPSGYVQTGLACTGAVDTDPSDGITIAKDENVICTFTNAVYVAPVLSCPAGYSLLSQTGNASSVIRSNNSDGPERAIGELASNGSNVWTDNPAVKIYNSGGSIDLGLAELVPQNATITVSIGRNGNQSVLEIYTSLDDSTYTLIDTYGDSGTITPTVSDQSLEHISITIPTGGAQYIRFSRNGNSEMYVDGVEYSQICEVAVVAPTTDYGDAPISGTSPNGSGTNNYGAASHTVGNSLFLGASAPDVEAANQPTAMADGDDTDGTNDDDGVSAFSALTAGDASYSIPAANVTASGTGTLHAWIDFNGDGSFESTEHASVSVASGALASDLSWSGQSTMGDAGTTFARFRLTTDVSVVALNPSGLATDGEVEDYSVSVAGPGFPSLDTSVKYCSAVTTDTNFTDYRVAWTYNTPTNTLLADHTSGNWPNNQFDSSVMSAANIQTVGYGMTYGFDSDKQTVIHLSGVDQADADGAFSNGDYIEYEFVTQSIMNLAQLFNGFAFASHNYVENYKISLLLSEDNFATATTLLSDYSVVPASGGYEWIDEATDKPIYLKPNTSYKFRVLFYDANNASAVYWDDFHVSMSVCQDYSDAPTSSYGETSHDIPRDETLFLGTAKADAESGSRDGGDAGVGADGDDTSGATPDDEEGVAAFATITAGDTSYTVLASDITAAGTGTLHAWIDFNGDGAFGNTEYATTSITSGVLASDLNWTGLSTVTAGDTYARFRVTTDPLSATDANTNASDGEIEDYALTIAAIPLLIDTTMSGPQCLATAGLTFTALEFNSVSPADTLQTDYVLPNAGILNNTYIDVHASFDSAPVNTNLTFPRISGRKFAFNTTNDKTVTYRFMEAGTTTPISLNVRMRTTDIDQNERLISATTEIAAVVTNNPTNLSASNDGSNITVSSQPINNSGDVGDIVEFVFINKSSVVITYDATSNNSGFNFDGAGLSSFSEEQCLVEKGDYSDAPVVGTSYGIAKHGESPSLYLGANVDQEYVSIASTNADGDGSDDDGISLFPVLSAGDTNYTIPAANVTSSGTGTLHAWIDFDGDGVFSSTEYTSALVNSGALATDLIWTGQSTMAAGTSFARFRLTTDSNVTATTPDGSASDGEVEDYAVTISSEPPVIASCDANPLGYVDINFTSIINDIGAGTGRTWTYPAAINYLGEDVDINVEVLSLAGGTDFDTVDLTTPKIARTILTSISQPTPNESFAEIQWTFTRSSDGTPIAISTEVEFLDIDLASTQRLESILVNRADYDGYTLTSDSTVSVSSDGTVDRFDGTIDADNLPSQAILLKLVNRTSLKWTQGMELRGTGGSGRAGFRVNVSSFSNVGCDRYDYSDAAGYLDTYHNAFSTLRMGAGITAEAAALATADADGDADDGVVLPTLTQGLTTTIDVAISEESTGDAYLQAWIDFDGNNVFDASEQIAIDLQDIGTGANAGDGIITISVTPPVTAVSSQTVARFRWSTEIGLDSTTPSLNGEVEDYALTIAAGPSWPIPPVTGPGDGGRCLLTHHQNTGVNADPDSFYTISDHMNPSTLFKVGPWGVSDGTVEGLTADVANGVFYALNGDRNDTLVLGNIDFSIGSFSDITTSAVGSLSHSVYGTLDIAGSRAIAHRPGTNEVWVAAYSTQPSNNISDSDAYLFKMSTTTGNVISGAFAGEDYMVIDLSPYDVLVNAGTKATIEALTFYESAPNMLYGVVSTHVNSATTNAGHLFAVDLSLSTPQAVLAPNNLSGVAYTSGSAPVSAYYDIEGMSFDTNGDLVIVSANVGGTNASTLSNVDLATGTASGTRSIITGDWEGIVCSTAIPLARDYGDAPASYLDASHAVPDTPTVYLGSVAPDSDSQSQNAVNSGSDGTGDDLDGKDDEDAYDIVPAIWTTQSSYRLRVDCSDQGAFVAGWVDFNKNGVFDTGERNTDYPTTCNVNGNVTLNWIGLSGLSDGNTYARLRIASDSDEASTATGVASDGEVEDYPVTIQTPSAAPGACVGVTSWMDTTGQAAYPDPNWLIDWSARGLSATVNFSTTMTGTNRKWVGSPKTFTDTTFISAFGSRGIGIGVNYPDDLSGTGSTIANIVFSDALPANTYMVVRDIDATDESMVFSNNNLGSLPIPSLWETANPLNSNANSPSLFGSWDSTLQRISTLSNGPNNDQEAYVFPVTGLKTLTVAYQTYAGAANVGFVSCIPQDYGDAPDQYSTLLASGGPQHGTINGVYLGSTAPDNDSDGQPSSSADGDGTDEDGVSALPTLTAADRIYQVTVSANNDTLLAANLVAWIDFDGNGSFDADEAAIRSVPAGSNNADITLKWSNIPIDIQAGDSYLRLRLTTDSLNNRESDGSKLDGEVEDYALTIVSAGANLSGRVYIDANSNAAEDGGESGISGTVVVIRNTSTGVCRSVNTGGSGHYTFVDVDNGSYEIYQAHGETTPVPQSCATASANNPVGYQSTTADILTVTVAGSNIVDQDFGEVAGATSTTGVNTGVGITFEPDHQSEVLPGNVIFYSHVFTTQAEGTVVFSTDESGNNATGWSHLLYRDTNCDGSLNGTEGNTPITGMNLGVGAGGQLCIIDKVYAPANAPAQDRYTVETTATFNYAGGMLPSTTLSVSDLTITGQAATPLPTPTIPAIGASRLELTKTVENMSEVIAQGLIEGALETSSLNQAKPGDVLRYRIYYRNTGIGSITDLKVNDSVPVYTDLILASATCENTPASLTCTPASSSAAVNWIFVGSLNGGASGSVSYEVMVEN